MSLCLRLELAYIRGSIIVHVVSNRAPKSLAAVSETLIGIQSNGSWLRAPRRSSSAHDTRQFHLACGHLLVCMDIKLPYFSSATDHIWRVHRLRHHAHLHERSCVSCGHISAVRRKCIGSKHVREKRSCGWVSSSGTADVQIAWHIMGYERPRIPVRPTYSSTDSLL